MNNEKVGDCGGVLGGSVTIECTFVSPICSLQLQSFYFCMEMYSILLYYYHFFSGYLYVDYYKRKNQCKLLGYLILFKIIYQKLVLF